MNFQLYLDFHMYHQITLTEVSKAVDFIPFQNLCFTQRLGVIEYRDIIPIKCRQESRLVFEEVNIVNINRPEITVAHL